MMPPSPTNASRPVVPTDRLRIDAHAALPKYQQVYDAVVTGIRQQTIRPGYRLPSIHDLSGEFDISHGTVEKAYRRLQQDGIVRAVNGKGFFVCHTPISPQVRVFLLFNKLSAHKKITYDALVESLGPDAVIDFHIYHNDFERFRSLLQQADGSYTHYVVVPHFRSQEEQARALLNTLPKHKLLILDKFVEGITGHYAAVYEDFRADIERALTDALPLLRKYHTLVLFFPADSYHPKAILSGFYGFCYAQGFQAHVVADAGAEPIRPGHAYINLMEDDLVTLVKHIKQTPFKLGRDVGILSYNETPMKEIILDGITVMSTDFAEMGRTAARLIRENRPVHVANPFRLIVRQSL